MSDHISRAAFASAVRAVDEDLEADLAELAATRLNAEFAINARAAMSIVKAVSERLCAESALNDSEDGND